MWNDLVKVALHQRRLQSHLQSYFWFGVDCDYGLWTSRRRFLISYAKVYIKIFTKVYTKINTKSLKQSLH